MRRCVPPSRSDGNRIRPDAYSIPALKLRWDQILSLLVLGVFYAVRLFRPIRRFEANVGRI